LLGWTAEGGRPHTVPPARQGRQFKML